MVNKALSEHVREISVSCTPEQFPELDQEKCQRVDCWMIECEDQELDPDAILSTLDQWHAPWLIGLGLAPQSEDLEYLAWQRRLLAKLDDVSSELGNLQERSLEPAREEPLQRDRPQRNLSAEVASEIWVLAASTGGPEAVKAFLDHLPDQIGVGFLYAQHVDAHFSSVLTDVLARHAALDLWPMAHNQHLCVDEVQVVPVDEAIRFSDGRACFTQRPWRGPYGPSIDELLENLLDAYGTKCNVIIFSGMGDDGARAAEKMRHAGCQVWVQSPETCANSSMPEAVIANGGADLEAGPEQLAKALVEYLSTRSANP